MRSCALGRPVSSLIGRFFLSAAVGNAKIPTRTCASILCVATVYVMENRVPIPFPSDICFGLRPTDYMMRLIPLIAAALLASACASPQIEEPQLNLSGYPPAFRDGYVDGCNSTGITTRRTRDEDRFKTDSMYAAGWRDGFDICSDN